MRALTWHGTHDVRVETVPDPKILNGRDCIVKVTSSGICGADLHLYDGVIPTLRKGDILGHEFMGEVVEVGRRVPRDTLKVGDRVVIPFAIACGACFFCERELYAACDNSNPADKADMAEHLYGFPGSGLFGYSHMMGGYAGGQAEYVRVPFADVGPMKVPDELPDDKLLFLSDSFPAGWMAAENCDIRPGDTVAVWGCGPVGQFAIRSAFMLGAERVIAIDHREGRLVLAREGGAETLDFERVRVREALADLTAGRGPDACIDAVGLEAHGLTADNVLDFAKTRAGLVADRGHVLREAIMACRKGGTVSVAGVYGGLMDGVPVGAAFGKGLTLKTGQTHVHRYMRPLLRKIVEGAIDPSFVISHRLPLEKAAHGYALFKNRPSDVTKVVLTP